MQGYTQNVNEALHSTVWKFCLKEIFMGRTGVQTACAMAVCCYNDGSSSLAAISAKLLLSPSPFSKSFLKRKDLTRVRESEYKASEAAKKLRRKGLDGREGVVYASGAFESGEPGPSMKSDLVVYMPVFPHFGLFPPFHV